MLLILLKKTNRKRNEIIVDIYIRVSILKEGFSLPEQKENLIDFCKLKEYEIHEIYADEGISAESDKRLSYQKMINDIKNGTVNVIVTLNLLMQAPMVRCI